MNDPGHFVKIYQTILDSSVWGESPEVCKLWITLLAMADADGVVRASRGGLARRAALPREVTMDALAVLMAPDPDDRSGVMDGVRVVAIQGGWRVVNHRMYRDFRTPKQVKDAARKNAWRRAQASETPCDTSRVSHAEVEAEVEAEAEVDQPPTNVGGGPATLPGLDLGKPAKPSANRKTTMGDDWEPPPGLYMWAYHHRDVRMHRDDVIGSLERFRNHFQSTGTKRTAKGWLASFRNWLFEDRRRSGQRGNPIPESLGINDDGVWGTTPRGFNWSHGGGYEPRWSSNG